MRKTWVINEHFSPISNNIHLEYSKIFFENLLASHQSTYHIPKLPVKVNLETVEIYKALALASRNLAELKGLGDINS